MNHNCVMRIIDKAGEVQDPVEPPVVTRHKVAVAEMASSKLSEAGGHTAPPNTTTTVTAKSLPTEGLADVVNGAEGRDDIPMAPDPGYTFLAIMMAVFCRNTDRNVRSLRQEMAQLREEMFSRVHLAPVPPPPTEYSRAHDGSAACPDQLVPLLSQLRQDPVLAQQAAHLVD
jgi:hypothetical protein